MKIEFEAEEWEYYGKGVWFFISLPEEYCNDFKIIGARPRKGFGPVRVSVTIGETS